MRRDPSESHDLWQRAENIAVLLTSRLRGLWSQQVRRGPPNLRNESDPALYGYTWMPWIKSNKANNIKVTPLDINKENINFSINYSQNKTLSVGKNKDSTKAVLINCDGTTGIRNFLCILKSVF